jgi:AcrR family transcriptional regulator
MEAATTTDAARRLEGDKAQRIIAAMRASVGSRGASASTFDHVAREAGVSRGLLHYYFGTKERLLVEVVRHDCDVRNRNMDERLAKANSASEIVDALVVGLEEFLEDDAGGQAVIYEMLSASRHSEEIRAELGELYRQWRERLAGWLRTKEAEGVISLEAEPEAVASILFSLGDGFGIQVLSDPDWDRAAAFELGVSTARRMLGASS